MLTRQHRLGSSREFKAVFSGGKTYAHRLLILKVLPTASDKPSRFAFSSSAKLGNSVARNRAKRLLRESLRLMKGRVKLYGYDAILIARPSSRDAHITEVRRAVESLLREAGMLDDDEHSRRASRQEAV